jgi:head-tail adaptor
MSVMLNRPLVLEDPVQVTDGAGGLTVSWMPLGTLWGEVKPSTGREVAGEEVRLASVGFLITVRGAVVGSPRRPRPEQRFRDGSRIFVILAVTERDLSGDFLTCYAKEEQPA